MSDFDEYQFRSIEEMYQDDSGVTFKQRPANIRNEIRRLGYRLLLDNNKILYFSL